MSSSEESESHIEQYCSATIKSASEIESFVDESDQQLAFERLRDIRRMSNKLQTLSGVLGSGAEVSSVDVP